MTKFYTPDGKYHPTGAEHPNWKGDKITLKAVHDYIKYYKPKPEVCDRCGKKPKRLDLANISPTPNKDTYTRDFENWNWLCRRCHMIEDGRMSNLMRGNKPKRYAKCGRDVVARGICLKQYNYERRHERGRTNSKQTPCESCAG